MIELEIDGARVQARDIGCRITNHSQRAYDHTGLSRFEPGVSTVTVRCEGVTSPLPSLGAVEVAIREGTLEVWFSGKVDEVDGDSFRVVADMETAQ